MIAPLKYDPSYETVTDDEPATEQDLVQTLQRISATTFADSGHALRSVHAKSHGLLRGEMTVNGGLPAVFAQGIFANPVTFPVVIRLSTSPGDLLDDDVSTPRGFALKVIGVEGSRLPGSEGETTQDFLMVNGPAFLKPDAKSFAGSLKQLAATTDKAEGLKKVLSAVLRGTEKLVEAVGGESLTLKSLGGHPLTHILGETFYTQTPFLYGQYMAKLSIAPVSANMKALKGARVDLKDHPDGLRDAVVSFFNLEEAQWELRVQLCRDIGQMPIEDASQRWSEDLSPYVAVAQIRVARQQAWIANDSTKQEDGLSFSPWHGIAAHRPLGSVNRARRQTYLASAQFRGTHNRCPMHEPGATAPQLNVGIGSTEQTHR